MEDRNRGTDRLFAINRELEAKWKADPERSRFFTPDSDFVQDHRNLQEFLIRKHFFKKPLTNRLGRNSLSLMHNVYALRCANPDSLQKIREAFYALPDAEVTDSIKNEFIQRWNAALYREQDLVFYYPVYPEDYFLLYDAPLLMYLYFQEKRRPGLREFQEAECPPFFYSVFEKTPKSKLKESYFGVRFQKNVPLKNGPVLSVPAFCMNGRLEAYRRFITHSNRAKNVHMFQYYIRWLPDQNTDRDPPGFREEDAWYFEMCTGLSLVTEITALLTDLDITPVISKKKDTETGKIIDWQNCRDEIITELLWKYRESITSCPAIYWRAAALRNAIRLTDEQCRLGLQQQELQFNPAYNVGLPVHLQRTKSGWKEFASKTFQRFFFNDLLRIKISRIMDQQVIEQSGFTNPVKTLTAPEAPRSIEFLYAAEACIAKCLNDYWEDYPVSPPPELERIVMTGAVKDSYTANREHTGFYFHSCLPKTDTNVEKMTQIAEGQCNALKKIRNGGNRDIVFETIHRTLYGTESKNEKGFRQPIDF